MSIPPRSLTPRRLAPAALLLGLCACAEEPTKVTGWTVVRGELPEPAGATVHDLASGLAFADTWVEKAVIDAGRLDNRMHLSAGWSYPNQSSDEDTEEIDPVWTDSEYFELTFALTEVAPRTVATFFAPFRAIEEKGSMSIDFSLNGQHLETVSFGRRGLQLELELPVEAQREGLNVLAMEASDCWRISHYMGTKDIRRVGVNAREFRFEIQDAKVRRRREAAFELLPSGVELRTGEPIEQPVVAQLSGTLLSYNLRVPAEGRLSLGLAHVGRSSETTPGAALRIRLTERGGERRTLLEERVEFGAVARAVDVSLAEHAGEVVQLDFEVEAAGGTPDPVVGAWVNPRILGRESPAPPPAEALVHARERLARAPVVLVLLDACNPSFISAYGGRDGLNPTLERLAEEGALFEQAYTHATYTISSVPNMLTSRYTWEHGAWMEETKLAESVPTWPEAFRDAGYRTVGISASTNGSSLFGFERGFEEFSDIYSDLMDGRETVAAEQFLEPLNEILASEDERPLMLWLHIVEPHEPYVPPGDWAGRFSSELPGELNGDSETLWKIRLWELDPTEQDLTRIKSQYEENLGYVDEVLARMRDRMEASGLLEEAIFVVFSDHGEGFLDHMGNTHQGMGHGTTVFDDQARIPLIFRLPEGTAPAGVRVDGLASNMDILPTVADLVGVEPPPGTLHGKSVAPLLFDPAARPREHVISHTGNLMHRGRFLPALGIREGDWKYIHVSGHAKQLYDLAADPGEQVDVAAENPVLVGYLRQLLRRETGFDLDRGGFLVQTEATELSEDDLARMRALGYVR